MWDAFEKSYKELETKCLHLQGCLKDKEERIQTLSLEARACPDCEQHWEVIKKLQETDSSVEVVGRKMRKKKSVNKILREKFQNGRTESLSIQDFEINFLKSFKSEFSNK